MPLTVAIRKRLKDFVLDIEFACEGAPIALLGASGSGKSMMLKCIAGAETPDEGRIVLNGKVLFDSTAGINLPSRERRVGLVFQQYALFPHLSVADNLGFGLSHFPPHARRKRVFSLLETIGMTECASVKPVRLSGGQQQRVALARAMAPEPELLLLDEPFSALDGHLRDQMLAAVQDTLRSFNGESLFVTHNLEEAFRLCPRILVLLRGKLDADSPRDSLFHNPPTLESARLTRCENTPAARYMGNLHFHLPDWNVSLKTVPSQGQEWPKTSHLGIRAQEIRAAEPDETENILHCLPEWDTLIDDPWRIRLGLRVTGATSANTRTPLLYWDTSRDIIEKMRSHPTPWRMCLPAACLFPIADQSFRNSSVPSA